MSFETSSDHQKAGIEVIVNDVPAAAELFSLINAYAEADKDKKRQKAFRRIEALLQSSNVVTELKENGVTEEDIIKLLSVKNVDLKKIIYEKIYKANTEIEEGGESTQLVEEINPEPNIEETISSSASAEDILKKIRIRRLEESFNLESEELHSFTSWSELETAILLADRFIVAKRKLNSDELEYTEEERSRGDILKDVRNAENVIIGKLIDFKDKNLDDFFKKREKKEGHDVFLKRNEAEIEKIEDSLTKSLLAEDVISTITKANGIREAFKNVIGIEVKGFIAHNLENYVANEDKAELMDFFGAKTSQEQASLEKKPQLYFEALLVKGDPHTLDFQNAYLHEVWDENKISLEIEKVKRNLELLTALDSQGKESLENMMTSVESVTRKFETALSILTIILEYKRALLEAGENESEKLELKGDITQKKLLLKIENQNNALGILTAETSGVKALTAELDEINKRANELLH